MSALAGDLAALAAAVGCFYALAATALAVRFLRGRPAPGGDSPALTILKPLHGGFQGLERLLEGYCDQDYDGPVQILFGVHDGADRAIAAVESLKARRPDADITLVVDPTVHGANGKVSNLVNIAAHARHGVLIISDADIGVPRDYLRQVTAELARPGVGAVTCLYAGVDGGGLWSRLGAMAITYGFLPNAVLGRALGLAHPCFGSTIALTADTLAAIGGFEAFADTLADDYEIGAAVRRLGLAIAMPPMTVDHLCVEPDLETLVGHELRWGRTVRQIDPAGYAGSLVTHPLPLALIAWTLMGFAPLGAVLILTALGVRIACKFAMDASTGAPAGRWWMIPARDVLSLVVFIASFAVNTVGWQGRRFRVGRDGVLSHS